MNNLEGSPHGFDLTDYDRGPRAPRGTVYSEHSFSVSDPSDPRSTPDSQILIF